MLILDLKLGKLFAALYCCCCWCFVFYVSDVCFQLKLLRLNFEMESCRVTREKREKGCRLEDNRISWRLTINAGLKAVVCTINWNGSLLQFPLSEEFIMSWAPFTFYVTEFKFCDDPLISLAAQSAIRKFQTCC